MSEDTDEIFKGFFIAGFSFIGLSVLYWCVKKRKTQPTMKKSTSTEQLNHEDPVVVH